jgi:hypothetical protein
MAKPIKIWSGSQWVDVAISVPSISEHLSDTTDVHGITNTANLVYADDSRLTNSRTPTAHASSHASAGSDPITIAQSQVTNLTTDLSAKAPLASPTLTGTPAAPTATAGTNTTQIATTAFVRTEVSNLIASAPTALDTLDELAAALGDDANFATTVNTALSNRVLTTGGSTVTVSTGTTIPLTIQNNGTGNSFVVNDSSSDTTPFVIDANGNVGIGISSPSQKLDVSGEIKASGIISGSSSDTLELYAGTVFNSNLDAAIAIRGTTVGYNDGGMEFYSGGAERIRISSSGNVGIGATDLNVFSLTVKGNSVSNTGNSRILAYGNTAASPTELNDWPTPVLSLRTFGDFYLNSMLSFGYSNDAEYKTDGSVWVFRLEDTAGGVTPSRVASSSTTALQLTGPGTLFFDASRIRLRNNAVLESPIVTNAQTASYSLVLSDAGKLIEINNSSATTLTIPADASVAFPVGTKIDVIQTGAGQITIAGSGFTPNATPGLKISAQWGAASLIKRGTNSWVVIGSLAA